MRVARLLLLLLLMPIPALAQPPDEDTEEAIRAAIVQWYDELAKKEEGRIDLVVGRPFFEATRYYFHADTGSAALGPPIYSSLAAKALQFAYDIDFMRIDPNFARVGVWERGYFYAAAAQRTYELAADSDSSSSGRRRTAAGASSPIAPVPTAFRPARRPIRCRICATSIIPRSARTATRRPMRSKRASSSIGAGWIGRGNCPNS